MLSGLQRPMRLIAAAAIVSSLSVRAEIPAAANWISNPSFEEGEDNDPVDWVYFQQHEKSIGLADQTAARSGKRGISFQGAGGLSYGRWITPYRIPLEPGQKYRVSFWYRGTGADVYLDTQAVEFSDAGKLSIDLSKTRKIPIAKPEPAEEWTYVEKEISAPGYPAWAQLCLGGNARDACAFDDVHFERSGLTLIEPRWAQVVPQGTEVVLKLSAPELRAAPPDAVIWKSSGNATVKDSRKNSEDGTWSVTVVAKADSDLQLEATIGGKSLRFEEPKYLRVFPTGKEQMFGFAAITDAHFYRKGNNERNEKFANVVSTLNVLDPLFVISLGDQMDIHSGFRDEQKKWIAEAVREQLGLLAMPVFMMAGNHEIDRTYEGSGTRWYFEKYLGQPRFWSFEIGDTLFAGIDVSTPGVATREHGASFLDPEQEAWLAQLLSKPRSVPVILAGHISPFGEWTAAPDHERFLAMLLGRQVGVYLCGHTHYTMDVAVPNGQTSPPWPKPVKLESANQAGRAIADPDQTVILTTTSVCAFKMGDTKMNGYRYLLVKDGKIVWQDVLPLSLSIQRQNPSPNSAKFTVTNGGEKAIAGLPIHAILPEGKAVATLAGKEIPCETNPLGNGSQAVWVRLDCPLDSSFEVLLSVQP